MARLLTAQVQSMGPHGFHHVAITHRCAMQGDALLRQKTLQAEVGHDRRRQRPFLQTSDLGPALCEKRHDLVAIRDRASLINQDHPIGVAIKANSQIRPCLTHLLRCRLRLGRTAAKVDVQTIGLDAEGNDLRPEFPQNLWRGAIGCAVGTVDHHLQTIQTHVRREGRFHPLHIAEAAVVDPFRAADVSGLHRVHTLEGHLLDRGFGVVVQFEAIGAEELDSVVFRRIVAGRDHHAHIGAHRGRQHPDGGCRHRAEQEHVHAGRGEARGQRVLDHVA
mmetsp:Transcript_7323/g.12823  ORF Transcript_7323/g.12823 Transcript_7323/m.12823 type:complete len:277 (+) Transcript_7323:1049-1879(+)